MEKIAILGYAFMVYTLINSTLFVYGFIFIEATSILISIIPVWIWGITAVYLLLKGKLDGLLLSTGFIIFTMFIASVVYYSLLLI
jgi:hypothetical protein